MLCFYKKMIMDNKWSLLICLAVCFEHILSAAGETSTLKCNIRHSDAECQNRSLTEFPSQIPENISSLNFSHNLITELHSNQLENLENLYVVDASFNIISVLGPLLFSRHHMLRVLFLDHNKLLSLNSSTIFLATNKLFYLSIKRSSLSTLEISNLYELKCLDASENSLRTLKFANGNVRSLKEVFLNDNCLENLTFQDDCINVTSSFSVLNLKNNNLKNLSFFGSCNFLYMKELNLENNLIEILHPQYFRFMTRLKFLTLSGNLFSKLGDFAFSSLPFLDTLNIYSLPALQYISGKVFYNLTKITHLDIHNNSKLSHLDYQIFSNMSQLHYLDLSYNNLSQIDPVVFTFLKNIKMMNLSGNAWFCECSSLPLGKTLFEEVSEIKTFLQNQYSLICYSPKVSAGYSLWAALKCMNCEIESNFVFESQLSFKLGSNAILDCEGFNPSRTRSNCSWAKINKRSEKQNYLTGSQNISDDMKHYIFPNGSLLISNIGNDDAGKYRYVFYPEVLGGVVYLTLDFQILTDTELKGLFYGLISAASFLLFAIMYGLIKICCISCSKKEKIKKSSVQEVLQSLRSSFQLTRFQSYKSAQLERLTAFRSATLEQLAAFKTARISRLRKYKQASLNSVLHYLDRMRVHYSNQTLKIKNNCQMQFDRLRENYVAQKTKFKDNRSQQVHRMRDNYRGQAMRIKDYGNQQLTRLREQYKHQQQNLMRLLELLEIGNCIHVIEADCSRTESMIFDSDIPCDLEEQPSMMLEQDINNAFIQTPDDVVNDVFENESDLPMVTELESKSLKFGIHKSEMATGEKERGESAPLISVDIHCTSCEGSNQIAEAISDLEHIQVHSGGEL